MINEFCIKSDHPAIQGHFPGNPVVPGALILEYVMQSVLDNFPHDLKMSGIRSVKFLMPILPDQRFQIEAELCDQAKIDFKVTLDSHVAVRGILNFRKMP